MKNHFTKEFTTALLLGIAATGPVWSAEHRDLSKIDLSKLPAAADKAGLTYAENIRPMLQESCLRCHGQDRPKAGLRLDTLDGALKGGKDGKVIVPGDSKQSLLVIAASQIDEETAMPPKRRPGRGRPGGNPGGPPPNAPANGGPGAPPVPNGPGQPPDGPPHGGPGGFGPPPKPLTAEQVGLVRAWIDQGAK